MTKRSLGAIPEGVARPEGQDALAKREERVVRRKSGTNLRAIPQKKLWGGGSPPVVWVNPQEDGGLETLTQKKNFPCLSLCVNRGSLWTRGGILKGKDRNRGWSEVRFGPLVGPGQRPAEDQGDSA